MSFLRHPADEFFNATVALDSILDHPADLVRVHEQLAEAGNHTARFQAVENFLIAHLAGVQPDSLVSASVSKLGWTPCNCSPKDLKTKKL